MPWLRRRLQVLTGSPALLLCALSFAADDLPKPNDLLKVAVKAPAQPNPAFIGQRVTAGFGLMFTTNTYRQEAQTLGIAEQKLTLRFEGGGGTITGLLLIGTVPVAVRK